MSETKEDLPKFDLKNIPLGGEKSVRLTLDSIKPIEGEGQYGTWYLWFALVENQKVVWGRGRDERVEEGYTGKVIFFAPDKMNESLLKVVNDKQGTVVEVTKIAEETSSGKIIKRYPIKLVKEGSTPSSSSSSESKFTVTESQVINDCKELHKAGTEIDETTFLSACQDVNINPIKAKSLYRTFLEETKND